MEFICEKKEIQNGVSTVERIVSTKSTLPIIGNILFQADKNGLKISANNLEIGIEKNIKAKTSKEGSVLIPAKTLSGLVSKLPDVPVTFKLTEKGTVKISYSRSNFHVHILPPDEFPVLPKIKDGKTVTMDPQIFASMVKQVIFAVSSSEDKHVLTGVLIELGKSAQSGDTSNIRMIATDGYRLAKRGEKVKLGGEANLKAIVPAKALQEIYRVIEANGGGEELKITIASDQIAFKYQDVYLISRIIQGQFPDYKQVIPKKSSTIVTLKTKQLLEAAERTAVIAAGSANIVRFEVKDENLHLAASTPDVGTIDEVVEAEVKGESKTQTAFNIRLIADMLKVVEEDKVILEMSGALGPGVVRLADKLDYLYIVMPIRTQEAA